ncbi:MAG: haloacid dehalogenase type II [Phycisphaeraceae bacterium]|nr:haloacid dehalogenase type II [Phycisphaerae bacterium]MBX3392239.1 haloacid dehalogenase type II [Phycisphaeraceae bacterium]
MIDAARVRHLMFDCYGTLIDWEAGILRAIRPVLSVHGVRTSDEELLERYARSEAAVESGTYRPYREVLDRVMESIGVSYGLRFESRERERLAASVGAWPAFPDTAQALARLGERFTLTVVSNVDDDLFEGSRQRLESAGARIDRLVSAQLCRSYKPSPRNFRVALALLDAPVESVLHVAQSLYHDVAPARQAGLTTAWINRRRGKPGSGATPAARGVMPDLELPDLRSLADMLCGPTA